LPTAYCLLAFFAYCLLLTAFLFQETANLFFACCQLLIACLSFLRIAYLFSLPIAYCLLLFCSRKLPTCFFACCQLLIACLLFCVLPICFLCQLPIAYCFFVPEDCPLAFLRTAYCLPPAYSGILRLCSFNKQSKLDNDSRM
jgi:hypothetical protein